MIAGIVDAAAFPVPKPLAAPGSAGEDIFLSRVIGITLTKSGGGYLPREERRSRGRIAMRTQRSAFWTILALLLVILAGIPPVLSALEKERGIPMASTTLPCVSNTRDATGGI